MFTHNSNSPVASGALNTVGGIRLDVQGLRAVAVLAVIIYHVNSAWLGAGFIGVDVFFVISGFIITSLLVNSGSKVNFFAFYAGRIRRIIPAYAVMCAAVCLVSAVLFLPPDFGVFYKSLKSAALFKSNHYFADFGSYFAPKADELPLLHTWSLAIEMQFYLLYPLLIVWLPQSWRLRVLALLTLALFIWAGVKVSYGQQDKLYFSLLARTPEFMLGATVALWARHGVPSSRASSALGFLGAGLLLVSFQFIEKQHFPGFSSIAPCAGAALLIAARRGPISSALSTRPMVWLGGLSYSLYLWHWPVLAFIRYYTGQYVLSGGWLLSALIITLVLAWFSYRFVEVPWRNKSTSRTSLPRWAGAALAVILLVLIGRYINPQLDSVVPVDQTRYADPASICHGQQVGDCKRGARDLQPSVLVIGDSHAAQLNYFFDQAGNELHVAYRVLSASSCVPIPGFDVERLPDWGQQACRAQIAAVDQMMQLTDKVIVAAMWQYQMQSPAFVAALRVFLDNAEAAGKEIIVLAQVPMFQSDVQRVRRFRYIGLPASYVLGEDWKSANHQVEVIASGYKHVHYVDFASSKFFADVPYQQGDLIYLDSHHLNEIGARRYGHFAGAQLQNIFMPPQSTASK